MKKRFTALLALLLVASLLAACGQEAVTETPPAETAAAETTPAEEPSVTIGFANASMNNGFFVTISNTLESLCKENGYDYVMYDCDWDNELQISQMEDLVNLGVNVIFLAPADVVMAPEPVLKPPPPLTSRSSFSITPSTKRTMPSSPTPWPPTTIKRRHLC